MTDDELFYIVDAIDQITKNAGAWKEDYIYDRHSNEFSNRKNAKGRSIATAWFEID
jgi:hypothetical protein